ncbi:MAG: riboflavin synthase [Deltaproteobacteria bacterium]|nr:riboflavin synthase [Deltaproteobacteria bacterium]MBW2050904.1 riboflavin synthase [Deltaproteobacteria bacterium]MBW2139563.1 riboflavin synthase [Deltaproteobacteria bacterium]MBW2322602.1 riboflavin synthase [Deltaproteobacteria bacterium]
MFTGIVQGLGKVTEIIPLAGEVRLLVEADFEWGDPLVIGESIAISGVCLTVTEAQKRLFSAHVSSETVSRTTLRDLKSGHAVNLERALRLSDRLGGHLVTGHVDGIGKILTRHEKDMSLIFTIGLARELQTYVIEKGSVAIDGISLTVNEVRPESFSVNIIPHTAAITTLNAKNTGDFVNLETDLIGKYVARFLGHQAAGVKIDKNFLAEHGFI